MPKSNSEDVVNNFEDTTSLWARVLGNDVCRMWNPKYYFLGHISLEAWVPLHTRALALQHPTPLVTASNHTTSSVYGMVREHVKRCTLSTLQRLCWEHCTLQDKATGYVLSYIADHSGIRIEDLLTTPMTTARPPTPPVLHRTQVWAKNTGPEEAFLNVKTQSDSFDVSPTLNSIFVIPES